MQIAINDIPKIKNSEIYDAVLTDNNFRMLLTIERIYENKKIYYKVISTNYLFINSLDKTMAYPDNNVSDVSTQISINPNILGKFIKDFQIEFEKESLLVHRLDFIECRKFTANKEKIENKIMEILKY